MTTRRHDIDWLRVIAIGLLLIYHIAIGFQPWGVLIGFIQNDKPMEAIWVPMSMLNVWRIPLLFFVSGMGVCFAMRKRNWKQLLLERTKRIFLPFVFGIIVIVPFHVFMWQDYYEQDLAYYSNPGHLWFLGNIFAYVLLLSPLFFYLKANENGRLNQWIHKVFGSLFGFLIIIAAFVVESLILKPQIFELYAMTWHGFFLGFLAFFFGYLCVLSGTKFWNNVLKWRWAFLFMATAFFVIRYAVFHLKSPLYMMSVESNLWIFAVFGLAYKYLNRPSKTLSYLSQGAYPIYIIHMIFLYLASLLIFPLDIPALVKFVAVTVFTGLGCFVTYELIIRRMGFLRPLFGLKYSKPENLKIMTSNEMIK